MKKLWSRLAAPLIILALLGLSVALGVSLKNSQGEDVTKKIGLDQKLGAKLPLEATFLDEKGEKVKLGRYFGKKPVVLMLVFYSCQGSCLLEFENATKSFSDMKIENIGRDYDVVSISIHPKETPTLASGKKHDVMEAYQRPGATEGWHFLTGKTPEIRKVADAIGYRYAYDEKQDRILHPTGLFVITPDGRISRYLYGVDYTPTLLRDSLVTAREGKINVPSEPILFGCFQYDPKTGKTRVNVENALKFSGIATVLIIVCSIFLMTRKGPKDPPYHHKEEYFQSGS
jgi:protein SCO1/2